MAYSDNYTNKSTIFDNGDPVEGDHVKSIYDELGSDPAGSSDDLTVRLNSLEDQASDEHVQDVIGSTIVAGSGLTGTYNDAAGTLTLDADDIGAATAAIAAFDATLGDDPNGAYPTVADRLANQDSINEGLYGNGIHSGGAVTWTSGASFSVAPGVAKIAGSPVYFSGGTASISTGTGTPPSNDAADAFGRSVTDGWGTADTGGAWSTIGTSKTTLDTGTSANFDVSGNRGLVAVPTTSTSHVAVLNAMTSVADTDVRAKFQVSSGTISGANGFLGGVCARVSGSSTSTLKCYQAITIVEDTGTAQAIKLRIQYMSAASANGTTFANTGGSVGSVSVGVAGDMADYLTQAFWVELRCQENPLVSDQVILQARTWLDGDSVPNWQATVYDNYLTSGTAGNATGKVGVFTRVASSASTSSLVMSVDDFRARAPYDGSTGTSYPRWDLIQVDAAGALNVKEGDAATPDLEPTVSPGFAAIAAIDVDAATLSQAAVHDRRNRPPLVTPGLIWVTDDNTEPTGWVDGDFWIYPAP